MDISKATIMSLKVNNARVRIKEAKISEKMVR